MRKLKSRDMRTQINVIDLTAVADGFGGYVTADGVTETVWCKVLDKPSLSRRSTEFGIQDFSNYLLLQFRFATAQAWQGKEIKFELNGVTWSPVSWNRNADLYNTISEVLVKMITNGQK